MFKIRDKWIVGYTTVDYLLLDLDDADFDKVVSLGHMLTKEYDLGSFLVMRSSGNSKNKPVYCPVGNFAFQQKLMWQKTVSGNYHIVFGRKIGYDKICSIVETLAGLGVLNNEYSNIRQWRGDITLRISADNSTNGYRPPPEPVYEHIISGVKNNEGVRLYKSILGAVKECFNGGEEVEVGAVIAQD